MAIKFNRQPVNMANVSERDILENRYLSSRRNLLIVIIATAVNLLLLVGNTGSYFLFSAYVPYFFVDLGMYYCNKYPAEVYDETFLPVENPLPDGFFIAMIMIAIVILVVYFLCFLFSKNHKVGWLITALVFFGIDTLIYFAIFGINMSAVLDIVFHVWVLYYLFSGVFVHNKLKKLPVEEPEDTDFTDSTVSEEPVLEVTDEFNAEAVDTEEQIEIDEVSE